MGNACNCNDDDGEGETVVDNKNLHRQRSIQYYNNMESV